MLNAPGVGHWFNRAKIVLAFSIGQKPSVALKIGVPLIGSRRICVQVGSLAIDLPDFDKRISHRATGGGEHSTTQMRNLSDGWGKCVV